MELSEREVQRGWQWLIGAGLFAVLLAVMLFKIDLFLNRWDREELNYRNLQEIRGAATMLGGTEVDRRNSVNR